MNLQTCVQRAELVTKARKRQLCEFSEFMRLNAQASSSLAQKTVCVAFGAFLPGPLPVSSPAASYMYSKPPGGREQRRDTVRLSPGGVSAVGPTASYLLLGINYPQLSDFPTAIVLLPVLLWARNVAGPVGTGLCSM